MAQKQRPRQKDVVKQHVAEDEVDKVDETTTDLTVTANENIELSFHPIQELEQHGVQASEIKKLKTAGFCTVESIAFALTKEIEGVAGISDKKAEKIIVSFSRFFCIDLCITFSF